MHSRQVDENYDDSQLNATWWKICRKCGLNELFGAWRNIGECRECIEKARERNTLYEFVDEFEFI